MCGRYTHLLTWAQIVELYGITNAGSEPEEFGPSHNQSPEQTAPVVRLRDDRSRELVMMRWGWWPSWATKALINAQGETLAEKKTFIEAFKTRRCLLPASGFYEWKRLAGKSIPHWIGMKDKSPFAIAGLWGSFPDRKTGEIRDRFLIVTTAPNALMATIHDRMPLILDVADYEAWLEAAPPPAHLVHPYPAEKMTAFAVSTRVNSPKNNDPFCSAPI